MNSNTLNRVPHIIFLYWVIKIASTTLGETGADMFSMTFELGYAVTIAIFLVLFLLFLVWKLMLGKYEPFSYWLTFTASAIVGTAISDFIDRTLGVGYAMGSLYLTLLLLCILALWHWKESSLSVERITTRAGELFYWSAFLVANTLGTAAGDYLADDLEAGFLFSALLISGILAITAILYYKTNVSRTLLFWIAFVMTRPFGATFGDLLTKTGSEGGLDFGTIGSSLIFAAILLVALVQENQLEKIRKS